LEKREKGKKKARASSSAEDDASAGRPIEGFEKKKKEKERKKWKRGKSKGETGDSGLPDARRIRRRNVRVTGSS